ncbi:imidazole glycerol phosphate synthase [Bacillus mobilis]|uniref:imidazole glycerol phosphate synthase n=1 Tax=Bacillus mobilis TaxID=2026190 RepID=UPI0011413C38
MKGVMTLTEKFDEYKKRDRIDSDYSDYNEEYAAEVAPQRIDYDYDEKNHKDDVRSSAAGSTAGFIALALSILSLFTFPTLFGLVSVLLGIYAYNRGATVTGGIAAIVGGIAALIAILFRVALVGLLFSLF